MKQYDEIHFVLFQSRLVISGEVVGRAEASQSLSMIYDNFNLGRTSRDDIDSDRILLSTEVRP